MRKPKLSTDERKFIELYQQIPGLTLFARNFTSPGGRSPCFKISVIGEKDEHGLDKSLFMRMDRLFEILKLDLGKLSQIFVEKPWGYYMVPKANRPIQPTAVSYDKLGACRACDDEGWQNLAMLMGKNIFQIHELGGDPPEYLDRAIYCSNGNIGIIDPSTWSEFEIIDAIDLAILAGKAKPQSYRMQ